MSSTPAELVSPTLPQQWKVSVQPLEEMDDAELCVAVRSGVPRAPSVLFDRHSVRIERVLYRILGPNDLEDPLNETFCRAMDRLGELVEPAGLARWLVGIAVNVAREQLRARRRRSFIELRPGDDLPEDGYETPIEPREAVRALRAVLDRMGEEDRIVFALRRLEELSAQEIADCLAVSLATAKRRIERADERFFTLAARCPALRGWMSS